MKKILKAVLCIVLVTAAAAVLGIAYLTITEFLPGASEPLTVSGSGGKPEAGQELTILTWNIGYAGLGKDSDFFMDGGEHTAAADRETVEKYLEGIKSFIDETDADIIALQEVDFDSARTYGINEAEALARGCSARAQNFKCNFVPYPLPPIGKVDSGLLTFGKFGMESAERISLPCPFNWPVRTANLKRCLLVSYIPLSGSDKKLVFVNLHLEAYDDGEGKIAQTNQLKQFICEEYAKGNYVIAGGDFNQSFPGGNAKFPCVDESYWMPGELDEALLPEGWSFCYDADTASCRLLNRPYEPGNETNQHYIIDGYIVSPNVKVKGVECIDLGFENADHNPILLKAALE